MRKSKKVFIIYYGDDWGEKLPLKKSPATRLAFEDWYERGRKKGIYFYRASIDWFDVSRFVFKKAWTYENKKWIKVLRPIRPDLIFDKIAGKHDYALFNLKQKINEEIKIFNPPLFRTLLDSKLSHYIAFKEFMPQSFLAHSKKELASAVRNIKSNRVVVKPLYGSGGFGILIEKKNQLNHKLVKYPAFVQEFVSAEGGVPGFTKNNSLADLRLVFMNHKLTYALSRIAKRGSFFTNFHQGARPVLVPKKFIPRSALRVAKKIIDKLKIFPEANYSIDFLFSGAGKPILMEINTTPGFDLLHLVATEKIKEDNLKELTKVIP
ncbi:MAG: hypothetical protein A3J76_05950 [Candidatus Moranbacteria bacterium RBG_13_45_13]|nr:MAG: hypothetical protein A3J76_05950 [Candidatus Moranbacteria bacterium RBG_13_45_13]